MTQSRLKSHSSIASASLITLSASSDCHSWGCITRELEQPPTVISTDTLSSNIARRRPSPLLMAASILTVFLLGGATIAHVQQAATSILVEASADFTHQTF